MTTWTRYIYEAHHAHIVCAELRDRLAAEMSARGAVLQPARSGGANPQDVTSWGIDRLPHRLFSDGTPYRKLKIWCHAITMTVTQAEELRDALAAMRDGAEARSTAFCESLRREGAHA